MATRIERDPRNPAYQFIPAGVVIPNLYETDGADEAEKTAVLKYFTPDSSWTWYVCEYDPEERLCFGLVIGHEREYGYFSLDELEEVRGCMGLPIERDIHFTPKKCSECR